LQEKKQPTSNSEEKSLVTDEVGDFPVVARKVALIVSEAQVVEILRIQLNSQSKRYRTSE
jgi:hypothetical protein